MAKRNIAGITIEIGGDTTKLQTALKGVDSQLAKTQSNLKDIDKLLKFKPGNTELLTQKQRNLTSAIESTKERLEQLKNVQTDALSPDEYDALQREIIETEHNLEDLEEQYRQFGTVSGQKLIAVGNRISETGEKITAFGTSWTKNVTAPIVGFGVAAYAAFNEVDSGLDAIILKTGATGDALDEMEGILHHITTSIPVDFETAGNAIGEINTRFGVTGEQLEDLSTKYIMFAQITGQDVTSAIDGTQKALRAFGLGADEAGDYLDYLAYVSQQTGADVSMLYGNVVANSTAFKEMGLSIYDATLMMGQLEVSGADSSAVVNGLSVALKKSAKDGKSLDTSLAELQDEILNGKDGMDGLTVAYQYFGRSGAQVYEAVRSGAIDFRTLGGAAQTTSGIVTDTFNATLDPADDFNVAMNTIKVTAASIAAVVMPALSTMLQKVRDIVLELKDKWDGLDDSQKENIIRIAGIVAAAGPMITVIGKLVSTVGSAITGIGKLTNAFAGMSPKMKVISIVVAALAALVIANWDDIKAFWESTLKPALKDLWQFITTTVVPKVKEAWQTLQPVIQTVFNAIKGFWEKTLKPAMENLFKVIVEKVIPAVQKAWEKLQPIVTGFFDAVRIAWEKVLKPAIEAFYKFTVETLAPEIKEVWEALQPIFEKVFGALQTAWEKVGAPIMQVIEEVWVTKFKNFEAILHGIIEFLTGAFSGDWKRAWEGIKTAFGTVFENLKNLLKTPINGVIGLLNSMISKIETAINSVISSINNKVRIKLDPISILGKQVFPGIDWGPNIKTVSMKRIKLLASGGVLGEGGRAIVGEHAPEFLTVRNGRAIVTPMNGAQRFSGETNNTFNIYAQPGQSVTDIANAVERILTRQANQAGAVYA